MAETLRAEKADPLAAVADALESAARKASEAVDAAVPDGPVVGEFGDTSSRWVYNVSYGLSYGMVFPAVLAAKVIPKDNPVVHGFVDGARAAVDAVAGKTDHA